MSAIEWIKESIGVCAHIEEYTEENLRMQFQKLEQAYACLSEAEHERIKRILWEQFAKNDLIYIYSILIYRTGIEDFKTQLLTLVQDTDFDVYLGSMLEYHIIKRIKGHYAEKRTIHRKNIEKFREFLPMDFSYIPVENRNKQRIAIITEQLLDLPHAPTRVVLNYAYALQEKLGYEVLLFVCPSDWIVPQNIWCQARAMHSIEAYRNMPIRRQFRDAVFRGYQINMTPYGIKEYDMMFSLIHEWNPLFVFSLGMINPVADLAGSFTTIAAQTMGISLPISEAEILFMSEDSDAIGDIRKRMDGQRILYLDKIPMIFEEGNKQYSREELGLPEDRFLITIVGNRLKDELDEEFVFVMESILQRLPSADFVIIGEASGLEQLFQKPVFAGRIYYLGFCEDLVDIYQVMDLYINPRRSGGGHSSDMALSAGIPVVTLPKCDVAYNVGEQFIVNSYEEMVIEVCKYQEDKVFYGEKKTLALAEAANNSIEMLTNGVRSMIEQIKSVL